MLDCGDELFTSDADDLTFGDVAVIAVDRFCWNLSH
jgi:hypothetical protein